MPRWLLAKVSAAKAALIIPHSKTRSVPNLEKKGTLWTFLTTFLTYAVQSSSKHSQTTGDSIKPTMSTALVLK